MVGATTAIGPCGPRLLFRAVEFGTQHSWLRLCQTWDGAIGLEPCLAVDSTFAT